MTRRHRRSGQQTITYATDSPESLVQWVLKAEAKQQATSHVTRKTTAIAIAPTGPKSSEKRERRPPEGTLEGGRIYNDVEFRVVALLAAPVCPFVGSSV